MATTVLADAPALTQPNTDTQLRAMRLRALFKALNNRVRKLKRHRRVTIQYCTPRIRTDRKNGESREHLKRSLTLHVRRRIINPSLESNKQQS
jgi:hypothetical protein